MLRSGRAFLGLVWAKHLTKEGPYAMYISFPYECTIVFSFQTLNAARCFAPAI